MQERENALRAVECEVRKILVDVSQKTTNALTENTKALERFIAKI